MKTCLSCGQKEKFTKTGTCIVCGGNGCNYCMDHILAYYTKTKKWYGGEKIVEIYVHKTDKCWDEIEKKIRKTVLSSFEKYADRLSDLTEDTSRGPIEHDDLGESRGEIDEGIFNSVAYEVFMSPEFKESNGHCLSEGLKICDSYGIDDEKLTEIIEKAILEIINYTRKKDQLRYAENLERAGRFEDAAILNDSWGEWDAAGDIRRKDHQVTARKY